MVSNGSPCGRQLFLAGAVRERQQLLIVIPLLCRFCATSDWTYLMEELSSSISSRSLLTSSCNCCLSCWSFPICSTVFCNVTALLIWMHQGGKRREIASQVSSCFTRRRTRARTHVRLGLQGGNQAAECLEADVDVGPPLLLCRYVCWSASLSQRRRKNHKREQWDPVRSETAKTLLRGCAPTCFCSFFTKGVQLPPLSDPGLGTRSNRHGEPGSDPGLLWTAFKNFFLKS